MQQQNKCLIFQEQRIYKEIGGIDYKFPIPAIVDELKKHKVIIEKQQETIDKQQVIIDDLARRLEILEGGK
jgi:chaperonin cofactor prefoldin